MLFGSDAHQALADQLNSREPGEWVANKSYLGLFGTGRPDLIRLSPFPYNVYELKYFGNDEAAKTQLARYLKTAGSSAVAGDRDLVFKDGPIEADSDSLFDDAHYEYEPGKYPGTIVYTMEDRPGMVERLGARLWNDLEEGVKQAANKRSQFAAAFPSYAPAFGF